MNILNIDAIIIATEWSEFCSLDFKELKKQMREYIQGTMADYLKRYINT